MDTIETTVTEDALAKDVKPASADLCEVKTAGKPDGGKTSLGAENEKNECSEEPDDLLEKIEEAVKDKIIATNSSIDNDISQSSEHDFLKRLEELEKDNDATAMGVASGANVDECDKITVGKLVLEVSANNSQDKAGAADSNGDEHVNELSSTTDEKILDKSEEKVKDSKQTEEKPSEGPSCDLKENGKVQQDLSDEGANKAGTNEASGSAETEKTNPKASTVSSTEEKKTEASSTSEKPVEENADIPKEAEKASQESEETIGSTTTDEKLEEPKNNVEAPKVEGKKEEEKIYEASSEAMAVDGEVELMEVDTEVKMDVDPDEDDDDCQIIDEEMVPVEQSNVIEQAKGAKDLEAEVQEPIVDSAKKETEDVEIIETASGAAKTTEEQESNEAKAEEKVPKNDKKLNESSKKEEKLIVEEKTPDSTTVSSQSENISINVKKSPEKKAQNPQVLSPGTSRKDELPKVTPKEVVPSASPKNDVCGSSVELIEKKESKREPSSSQLQTKSNTKDPDVGKSPRDKSTTHLGKEGSSTVTAPKTTEKESPKVPEKTQKESSKVADTTQKEGTKGLQTIKEEVSKVPKKTQDSVKQSESPLKKKSAEPEKYEDDKNDEHISKSGNELKSKDAGTDKVGVNVREAAAIVKKAAATVKEAEATSKKAEAPPKKVEPTPKEAESTQKKVECTVTPKKDTAPSIAKEIIASSSAKEEDELPEDKQPEADSTKDGGKAAKLPENASENTTDNKDAESEPALSKKESDISKPSEVKEHYSDSTASLSSTADEQIIKLCMETTLPSVEAELEPALLKIENKPLINMMKHGGSVPSLNTTPVTASNVFNSTPIQKQFDISSENVSKISEVAEASGTEKTVEDDLHHTKSCKPEYSSDTCTTTDHHHSSSSEQPQSDHQSSGSITKYVNVMKKFNGITDSTTDDESLVHIKSTHSSELRLISSDTNSDLKAKSVYEINIQYDDKSEISFLSIEKLDSKKANAVLLEKTTGSEISDQGSSNGSVTSLTPFTLPVPRLSEVSSSSGSTLPQDAKTSSKRITLQGTGKLCNYIIDEFTKLKRGHTGEGVLPIIPTEFKDLKMHDEPSTPKSLHREYTKKNLTKRKSASPAVSESSPSPLRAESKRSRKRSFTKSQDDEDEDEGKPKAKQPKKIYAKSQGTPSKEIESAHCELSGQCVLAKWVDKKYYAGRITGEKPGNKYVVLFEDGASKTLPKESIVFGEGDTLPLKDMQVHGLVDDDFECGVVVSIDKVEEKVLYTVQAEMKTVKITASDIYLTEEQAKSVQGIQTAQKKGATSTSSPEELTSSVLAAAGSRSTRNKRTSTSPVTPEPGYSGGVGKKGAKRQKRLSQIILNRISESSELSDTQESSPGSPDTSVELVEGLQPELQPTDKDSELSKMIFIADYLETHPTSNPRQMLGKLPNSTTLFRNKCFILTCTVGLKPHRYVEVDKSNENSKSRQFSKVPFVKSSLQKQIEEGGGVVYRYFEEIPKKKYRQCKLIAPQPCTTAKYVQCLAADIQAVSHEWIINSCNSNTLEDIKKYLLPSGWSILTETYIRWDVGKSMKQRLSKQPLNKTIVLLGSEHKEFVTFWSRVCKLAGATIRYVKSIDDVTPTTKGIMVCDLDFPDLIKGKTAHFNIPIVSTAWIVQSLINGRSCEPNASPKLKQLFPDDDF